MGEAASRDVAFRNKEIDASILGPAQYVAYQADPDLSKGLLEVAEVYTRNMGMNPKFKPFADKRVRQAINYAIDSDLIIKRLVKGKAYRATSWLPLSSPAYDKNMKAYPYDPEKAKKLLAEAGYADGFEFEWTRPPERELGIPIVEAVIPMLEKVGIKVKIKPVEGTVLSEVVSKGDYQAYIWSNTSGPDPLEALKCFHSATPQSACNYTTFKNPELDKILDDAADRRGRQEDRSPERRRTPWFRTKRPCGSSTTTKPSWPISLGSRGSSRTLPNWRIRSGRDLGRGIIAGSQVGRKIERQLTRTCRSDTGR